MNNFDHLDVAIAKGSKRKEPACCAIPRKTLGNETVIMASVPRKPIALSAVSINIDQRALANGSAGNNNASPAYRIQDPTSTSISSEVSCFEKDNPPSSMVDNIDKESNSSKDLESVNDGIQSLETVGSDNVGNDNSVNQDGTSTLRFIEKSNGDLAGVKNMNCEQRKTEK